VTEGQATPGLAAETSCSQDLHIRAVGKVLTYQQLVQIRMRIGEIGTMLIASPRTINIIREVLRVAGVVMVRRQASAHDPGSTAGPVRSPHALEAPGAATKISWPARASETTSRGASRS
jgi:hypothetical protein